MLFAWLRFIMLAPIYSVISYGNIVLDLRRFDLGPIFQKHN
jgi:hypothetical protein